MEDHDMPNVLEELEKDCALLEEVLQFTFDSSKALKIENDKLKRKIKLRKLKDKRDKDFDYTLLLSKIGLVTFSGLLLVLYSLYCKVFYPGYMMISPSQFEKLQSNYTAVETELLTRRVLMNNYYVELKRTDTDKKIPGFCANRKGFYKMKDTFTGTFQLKGGPESSQITLGVDDTFTPFIKFHDENTDEQMKELTQAWDETRSDVEMKVNHNGFQLSVKFVSRINRLQYHFIFVPTYKSLMIYREVFEGDNTKVFYYDRV